MKKTAKTNTEGDKFGESIDALEHALSFEKQAEKDSFYFTGIVKSFEVCFEYAWKQMRREVLDRGLAAPSPKDAIKVAGQLGLIDDVEKWFDFLEDRNLAVHDYLGVPPEDYLKSIKAFLVEAKKLLKRIPA